MDNGGTVKEGVGRTYAGVDGYCPLAAYLGPSHRSDGGMGSVSFDAVCVQWPAEVLRGPAGAAAAHTHFALAQWRSLHGLLAAHCGI
jgi:hypothetical protein